MDEEPKKGYQPSSISEISSLIDKIERQMRPLSYNFEKINRIQNIARQYEHLDPARSMAAAASKVFEQLNPAAIAAMEAAKSANLAQSQFQNALASQNNIHKMLENSQANNNAKLIAEQAMKSIYDSYPYKDMRALSDQWKQSIEPYQSAWETVRKSIEASESFKIARQLQSQAISPSFFASEYSIIVEKIESFRSVLKMNDFQFEEILSTSLTEEDIKKFIEKPISKVEDDLSDEIKLAKSFSLYSDQDKKYLSYIYHYYFLPSVFLFLSLTLPNILQVKEEIKTIETKQQLRSFVRSTHTTFNPQVLKDYRFVIADLLNFRDRPSMNSNVIDSLPIGTTVRVINKSNRSWLLVEVEINGELEQGWVLRRYTTYFK